MSDLTISGQAVYEAEIVMPLSGAWTATVQLDSEATLPTALSLAYKGETWSCSLVAGGVYGGRYLARLVGGTGGLRKKLPAKWYRDVTVRAVLADLARESGETFSTTILSTVLDRILPTWTRQEGSAGGALGELASVLGMTWRVLRDGTVWIGSELWPEVTGQFVVTDERPQNNRITVAPETAFLVPGVTFRTKKVNEVEYVVKADSIRVNVLLEGEGLRAIFEGLVRWFMRDTRYHRPYFGRVVTQNEDGTLDVSLETTVVPSPTKTPIRYGMPGVSVKIKPGARVAVEYEDGDARRPIVTMWDQAEVDETHITSGKVIVHAGTVELGEGGRAIARHGDLARVAAATTPLMDVKIVLGPVSPGGGPVQVLGYFINGVFTSTLPGQVSAFSSNKSN